MSRRTNRLSAELAAFAQQYKRKSQRGVEPNDRGYSRETEELMKRLPPEELSAVLKLTRPWQRTAGFERAHL